MNAGTAQTFRYRCRNVRTLISAKLRSAAADHKGLLGPAYIVDEQSVLGGLVRPSF